MAENLPFTPNMDQYCRFPKKQHCRWSQVGCWPGTEVLLNARRCHPPSCTASTIITSWHPDNFTTTVSVTSSCTTSTTSTSATSSHLDNNSATSVYHLSYIATTVCLLLLLCDTTLPPPTLVRPLLLLTTHWLPIVHSVPTHSTHIWSSYCLSSSIVLTSPSSHTYLIQTAPTTSTCTADYLPVSDCSSLLPISFLPHPDSSWHILHPTTCYCDHTPWSPPTSHDAHIRYESIIIASEFTIPYITVLHLKSILYMQRCHYSNVHKKIN